MFIRKLNEKNCQPLLTLNVKNSQGKPSFVNKVIEDFIRRMPTSDITHATQLVYLMNLDSVLKKQLVYFEQVINNLYPWLSK